MAKSAKEKQLEAKRYLDRYRIKKDIYIIGIHQAERTVYKTQVRALNLFHSLFYADELDRKDLKILVVGSGMAGITFAAAAIKAKIDIQIIEKLETLIPFQSGCSKREIHPHLYDFPDDGSLSLNANLPVMNWDAGYASNVAEKMITEFHEIIRSNYDNKSLEEIIFTSTEIEKITASKKGYKVKLKDKNEVLSANIIVFASGYGIERSVAYLGHAKTPFYWRDSDHDQAPLQNKNVLISGIGDGGLADLFIFKIKDFKYSSLLKYISENPKQKELESALRNIKKTIMHSGKNKSGKTLLDLFNDIEPDSYKYILDKFNYRKTKVILNGSDSLENSLSLTKVSLINAFVTFLLKKSCNLSYEQGKLEFDEIEKKWFITGRPKNEFDNYIQILRHGVDTSKLLIEVPELRKIVFSTAFVNKQTKDLKAADKICMWSDLSFRKILNPLNIAKINQTASNAYPLLINLTETLSSFLDAVHRQDLKFRLALHKILVKDGIYYFQQITPYASNEKILPQFDGGFGNIYPINAGSVGYSIRTGKASLIIRNNEHNDKQVLKFLELLNIPEPSEKIKAKRAFFTLPINTEVSYHDPKSHDNKDGFTTNLILYIDSDSPNFFEHKLIPQIIYQSLKSFLECLHHAIEFDQIQMQNIDIVPILHSNVSYTDKVHSSSFFARDSRILNYFKLVGALKTQNLYSFISKNK